MAAGVILAARDLGLSVPGNLSVIGIDAHPIGQSFGLTTLDQHAHDQGVQAVENILDQLAGASAEPTNNVLPTNFLVRSSTAPPPDQ
jgi:DNA-binding LacI/PurR family transcriptional regulator